MNDPKETITGRISNQEPEYQYPNREFIFDGSQLINGDFSEIERRLFMGVDFGKINGDSTIVYTYDGDKLTIKEISPNEIYKEYYTTSKPHTPEQGRMVVKPDYIAPDGSMYDYKLYEIQKREKPMSIRGLSAAATALLLGASAAPSFDFYDEEIKHNNTPWGRNRHHNYTGEALQQYMKDQKRLRARNLTRANRKRARRGY